MERLELELELESNPRNGYILGPLIFGPLSEKFGRKQPLVAGVTIASLFGLMPALGQTLATVLLGRFFAGLFGIAPIAILGGIITDCWNAVHRGVALALCICLVFSGPTLGPIVGGYIVQSSISWRWTMWVMIICGLAVSLLALFTYPETYPPSVIQRKAKLMRKKTGNENIRSKLDLEETSLRHVTQTYLIRPWILPNCLGEVRGWSAGIATLPLLGIIVGILMGTVVVIIYTQTYFKRKVEANDGVVKPEDRLPLMILGGCLVPVGLFWYAWTSSPSIAWPSECFTYIIDCYTSAANSAMAANGAVRSVFGAAFPLFADYMYHKLGVDWATSLVGFIAVIIIPVPAVFWRYGARIRARSKSNQSEE
ncbi:hypothetical protein UA08_01557 [Talaromyces atroroseus]|uniref:Major facilitator superfamily (MFS) profile domain-containing protein n=1 Tax=Talaromyces atroroseus TaxID=1441469 RepID=A0A1Q5QC53_TALAT|nr:hypothetical protein UA08_01557 [Talaromyces atroroseus]OKL63500.1 hypothetical protein UA08_01557 [Talaromyces atroroseus]